MTSIEWRNHFIDTLQKLYPRPAGEWPFAYSKWLLVEANMAWEAALNGDVWEPADSTEEENYEYLE